VEKGENELDNDESDEKAFWRLLLIVTHTFFDYIYKILKERRKRKGEEKWRFDLIKRWKKIIYFVQMTIWLKKNFDGLQHDVIADYWKSLQKNCFSSKKKNYGLDFKCLSETKFLIN
jgi:hypothetical protein